MTVSDKLSAHILRMKKDSEIVQQLVDQMRPQKPGAACHENAFATVVDSRTLVILFYVHALNGDAKVAFVVVQSDFLWASHSICVDAQDDGSIRVNAACGNAS